MTPLEQEARRVAEWVLAPGNEMAWPLQGQCLWINVSNSAAWSGRVWGWNRGRADMPAVNGWHRIDWSGVPSVEALALRIKGALERAQEQDA